jgi:protoporphyrinogen oxidase
VGYEALVSSIPLPVLIDLLDDPPREVVAAARKLRCTHLWYLDVALAGPAGHDFHWVYVPEERYPFYRVGCYTNFSDALAPPGRSSLYVELASRETPHLETVARDVVAGLSEMGWIGGASDVAFVRLRRIDHAYVIFDRNYFGALSVIHPFLLEEGIVAAGRYGAWNYSSMEDALRFGREAAVRARELVND